MDLVFRRALVLLGILVQASDDGLNGEGLGLSP